MSASSYIPVVIFSNSPANNVWYFFSSSMTVDLYSDSFSIGSQIKSLSEISVSAAMVNIWLFDGLKPGMIKYHYILHSDFLRNHLY